jgi:hypothetical protein
MSASSCSCRDRTLWSCRLQTNRHCLNAASFSPV